MLGCCDVKSRAGPTPKLNIFQHQAWVKGFNLLMNVMPYFETNYSSSTTLFSLSCRKNMLVMLLKRWKFEIFEEINVSLHKQSQYHQSGMFFILKIFISLVLCEVSAVQVPVNWCFYLSKSRHTLNECFNIALFVEFLNTT